MERNQYTRLCRDELDKHGLTDWSVRLSGNVDSRFLGLCSHKDKCIILNPHHLDINPEPAVINTILHEVAHALTPGHGHDEIWADKARAVGCTNTNACSGSSISPEMIDAIRSGATVEVTYETETVYKPKYQVTRLQDKCPTCGKVAKTKNEILVPGNETKPDKKFITLECGHLIIKEIPKGTPFHTLLSEDNKSPYPFQVESMRFIETSLAVNKGAACFHEMGLGKTPISLGYLKFHPEKFPVLFVVKSGIKFQWFKEILRWMGGEYFPQVISSSTDPVIPNLKCYIISYDLMVHKTRKGKNGKLIQQGFNAQKLIDAGIKTVVLDECQQIKNPDSSRTQEVRKLVKNCQVIGLSGTPWKNRGSEFFTILNMLAPMKFPSYQGFLTKWVDFYEQGERTKMGGIRNVPKFKEYIKDIALRYEVNDVLKELPEVNRTMQFCELDKYEQAEYDENVSEFVRWYNNAVIGGEEDNLGEMNILAKLQRMRHICGLAKIPATEEFCEDFIENTERKLCIFVHHKDVGQILHANLTEKFPGIKILKLTAELDAMQRFEMQELFNNTPKCIMVASTLASGEGINLQTCADAIMHERQWNPANEDQAAPGRFRRIGSEHKVVNVTFMTAAGTVDEILGELVERKRADFHNSMNKGDMPTWNSKSIAKELAEGIIKKFKESGKRSIKELVSK